jgi:hypothetical protein
VAAAAGEETPCQDSPIDQRRALSIDLLVSADSGAGDPAGILLLHLTSSLVLRYSSSWLPEELFDHDDLIHPADDLIISPPLMDAPISGKDEGEIVAGVSCCRPTP